VVRTKAEIRGNGHGRRVYGIIGYISNKEIDDTRDLTIITKAKPSGDTMGKEAVEDNELTLFHPREKGTTTRVDKRVTSEITKTSIEVTTKDSIGMHRERT
jgi:hypothetical protein